MINSVSNQNNYWWLSQLTQTNQSGQSVNGSGNNQTSTTGVAGGGFINALATALSQIGINSTSSSSSNGDSSSSSSSQNPAQALVSFLQDLMAALQSQNGGQLPTSTGTDSDNDNDGSSASTIGGTSGHHHHHNRLEANLQGLIQQLSSSSSNSTASTSTDASTSTTNSAISGSSTTSSTLSSLQQSFQNLLTAYGDTGNSTSLQNFLQAFANNLDGSKPVGKVLQTQA